MPTDIRLGVSLVSLLCGVVLVALQPAEVRGETSRQRLCLQLEQELANEWVRGKSSRRLLPDIDRKIRKHEDAYQKLRAKADRSNCYENVFIFGRSLKKTRKCIKLDQKIRREKNQLVRLQLKRKQAADPVSVERRRELLIDKLARNGCGKRYKEASRLRNRSFWWEEEDSSSALYNRGDRYRRNEDASGIVPYATYRTMCVRMCDGYYFPISFSTLSNHFAGDATKCQSKCAAPAELYVYRNPGEDVEHMVSADGARRYNTLPNAWKYRDEYVDGCSCDPEKYAAADPPQ
jgi:hypothetical protein